MPHTGQLMTCDEYFALDYKEYRHTELVDGVFIHRPGPMPLHQVALMGLWEQIHKQLPRGWRVFSRM